MRSERPLLLHVTTTDISLELLLGPQLRAFRRHGYDVQLASSPGPFSRDLVDDGFVHHPLRHATRSIAPHHDVAAFFELVRLFRQVGPDIVHTHNPKPGIYGRIAARVARVPLIVNTQHGMYAQPGDRLRRRLPVYALERLAAACGHMELVQSRDDLAVLRRMRVPATRTRLLGNGVDLARFRPGERGERDAVRGELGLGPNDVVCGAVGRLVWEKGYGELFEAARLVQSANRTVRFVVVGPEDPTKSDRLRPEIVQEARRNGVIFLGMRHDVERLYRAMDIYVLASHREGYPRSAMEAAASGLPVVATDIRGCREVVEDGITGRLVSLHRPDELAAALLDLAGDPAKRSDMGRAALLKASRDFDQERVIATSLETYRSWEGSLHESDHREPLGRTETDL